MNAALGSLKSGDRHTVELLRVIRARFGDEHVAPLLALVRLAPHAERHTKRLPAAAYRRGLIAGLSYDSTDKNYPECPYDAKALPNFLSGDNDPRKAWRDGSRDALRIRDIVLRPQCAIVPALRHSEFKVLSPDLQRAHDTAPRRARA